MYGQGSNVPTVLGACTGAAVCATVLPQTGMNTAIQLALAVAAGLAVWAGLYVVTSKFSKR